jgi:branched-chain amino acid transport system permease protein
MADGDDISRLESVEGRPISPIPDVPDERDRPRIGVDEWVASAEGRTQREVWRRYYDRIPQPALFAAFAVVCALIPFMTSNDYVIRVGFDTLLYMLLALGLNIVVGFAGLLDLGYVAFYGIGAYGYAMLASPKFGIHWPTPAVVAVVTVALVIIGFLVGLPSRRLVGDYLAIVTLFFGQLFVTVYNNGSRISLLGIGDHSWDITGGPNGIANIDAFNVFGKELGQGNVKGYFWIALLTFVLVITALYFLNESRTGRAWRSLREDPLAAELMGMPVNRLKLIAFAFGAGVAGLTGTLFASLNSAVFATAFDVPLLITVYAMLILGGAGSLAGVIIGAILVNVSLEVLRTPDQATWVFYSLLVITLVAKLRPWRWLAAVVGGTIGFGFAVHAIGAAVWERSTKGTLEDAGLLGSFLKHWVLLPSDPKTIGNYAFVALVAAVLVLTLLKGWAQKLALIPVLYLAAFVWENRLVVEPSVTRLIFLGALLIVLMNARPQGIVGTAKVEIA